LISSIWTKFEEILCFFVGNKCRRGYVNDMYVSCSRVCRKQFMTTLLMAPAIYTPNLHNQDNNYGDIKRFDIKRQEQKWMISRALSKWK
jgi:hypothetical protein